MRYTKIESTFLNFNDGQRVAIGTAYASQIHRPAERELFVRTFSQDRWIETRFILEGERQLHFRALSDDSSIPEITGEFLNTNYDECVFAADLTSQGIHVAGVCTKIDETSAISTKTLTNLKTGTLKGLVHERVTVISEATFTAAVGTGPGPCAGSGPGAGSQES